MDKSEIMGRITSAIGPVGHLSNPNSTDPLKRALYQAFEAVLDMVQQGTSPQVKATPEAPAPSVSVAQFEHLASELGKLTKLEDGQNKIISGINQKLAELEKRLAKVEKTPTAKGGSDATTKGN